MDRRRVQISDLEEKCYLFKFFHEADIVQVENGALWNFNNHLLIIHWLKEDEDPMQIPLVFANFWVQVHDLPSGSFLKVVARQFGNFIGKFIEYDT
ncbi:hypothetical protein J1N35_010624 [Gossypium stocksii]|uniref:DUF4283 domain-containing protein n=1 Tax=Gossypium stocksii TaxID=47602 RepID=A0A9D3W0Q1_9ROSI|nr:hypothetical protein J1N35_010624 [Gossypium stocksii]